MNTTFKALIVIAMIAMIAAFGRAQSAPAPSVSTAASSGAVDNSEDGLRRQLADALAAAKDHNRPRLESLIQQMEIPDSEKWFTSSFGSDKGESWAGPYAQNLAMNEKDLVSQFVEIASQEGELVVRKVNDAPQNSMESAMIGALQRPLDVYYAGWKSRPTASEPFHSDLIGFFVFIDGRFRWDSTIRPMKIAMAGAVINPESGSGSALPTANVGGPFRPGTHGVGYPACSYCPDPQYSREARAKRIEGTVVLQAIVMPDGTAADIRLVKSLTSDLDNAAIEAVARWRFKPARNEDHVAVPVIVPIEVTFRMLH